MKTEMIDLEDIAFCLFRERLPHATICTDYKAYWENEIGESAKDYWTRCAKQYLAERRGEATYAVPPLFNG